jgi:hypothetical protein
MVSFNITRLLLKRSLALVGVFTLAIPHGGAFASTALGDPATRGSGASSAGGLAAVEGEVKAGEVTVGATALVVVRFRNDGSKEVKIGQVNLYPSSTVTADVGLNECSAQPLASGAECAIVVSVKGLKTGNWRVEMLLRHDGKSRIVTASLTGTVAAGQEDSDKLLSDVETIPSEVDFGTLSSSRPLVKSVVMRNVTSIPVNVKNVSVHSADQAGYILKSDCAKLEIGQACVATVTWSPTSKGQSDGVLVVEHTGATKVASVNLKGTYDPEDVVKAGMFPDAVPGLGLLISSQEEIDFGTVSNEASMTVSLVNIGDSDMAIGDISLGGTENGLSVGKTGCKAGTVLEPIAACPLTITWSPSRVGAILDDVQIRHDGTRGVLVIPVRGTSSEAVNKDTKAIVVNDQGVEAAPVVDKGQALDGFIITSHSSKKAVINGPGGSRIVSQGQELVLGGVEWTVNITKGGVEFLSGKDRVRLLFDRSLSSSGRTDSSSSSTTSSSASSSAAAAATTTSTEAATATQ